MCNSESHVGEGSARGEHDVGLSHYLLSAQHRHSAVGPHLRPWWPGDGTDYPSVPWEFLLNGSSPPGLDRRSEGRRVKRGLMR